MLRPEARGHGLGPRLVDAALARAREAGYARIELITFSELTAAARIYRAAGFVRVSRRAARAVGPRAPDGALRARALNYPRRVNPRVLIALVLVAVFALGATVLAAGGSGDDEPPSGGSAFEGAVMPSGLKAPDFELRNQDGEPISMRSLRGKPVVVTFLYTHCEDTCPARPRRCAGALDQLGHDVPAIAVAVDPPNDTEASARAFLSEQRALGRIDFVLGSRASCDRSGTASTSPPQSVTQEHQARFTLVDARGYQRVGFPGFAATPEGLAHDLRILERAKCAPASRALPQSDAYPTSEVGIPR